MTDIVPFCSFFVPELCSFGSISAAVRLGHKYEMSTLLEQAIAYLKSHYTQSSLLLWSFYRCKPPAFSDIHAIGVVNLARLTEETSLLPMALLACCQLNQELTYGFVREDGTLEQLSQYDNALCVAAKTRLIQASIAVALEFLLPEVSASCGTHQRCLEIFRRLYAVFAGRIGTIAGHNPFAVVDQLIAVSTEAELCEVCWAMAIERGRSKSRAVWDSLPDLLGIA